MSIKIKNIENKMLKLKNNIEFFKENEKINNKEHSLLQFYYKRNIEILYFISLMVNNNKNAFIDDFKKDLADLESYIKDTNKVLSSI